MGRGCASLCVAFGRTVSMNSKELQQNWPNSQSLSVSVTSSSLAGSGNNLLWRSSWHGLFVSNMVVALPRCFSVLQSVGGLKCILPFTYFGGKNVLTSSNSHVVYSAHLPNTWGFQSKGVKSENREEDTRNKIMTITLAQSSLAQSGLNSPNCIKF